MQNNSPVDSKGRYLHWDKHRHLPLEDGDKGNEKSLEASEQWWACIKTVRRNMYKPLPLGLF